MQAEDWYADCFDTDSDDEGFKMHISELDKYVCRSDLDEQILETWIKRLIINCDGGSIAEMKTPIEQILERGNYGTK